MYTIFHNPRCSKSRQGLEILKNSGVDFKIREYLKEGSTPEISELKKLQKFLGFEGENSKNISQMIRVKEKFWKEEAIDIQSLLAENSTESIQKILEYLVKFPKGLERPILIQDDEKAIIGRPPENFIELL